MSMHYKFSDKYALGYHMHLAFIALTDALNQELRRVGLDISHPHFTILQVVSRRPGLSQSELARETAKDNAAITRSLAYLEKQGLLQRKWINGCTKGVFATELAENLRPLLEEAIRKTIDRACADLDEENVELLNRLLGKIRMTLIQSV